jgi:aryl-alcohol dehydrogenase-like predicted oxidoreductase
MPLVMLTFCHEATKMIDPTAPQPVGDTALRVSKISFGMWGLAQGWGAAKGTRDIDVVLDEAWNQGISHFDNEDWAKQYCPPSTGGTEL